MNPNSPLIRRLIKLLLLLASATLLACGGGEEGASAPADKYVGAWVGPCIDLSAALGKPNAYKTTLSIKKTADAAYSSEGSNTEWSNATCAGAGTAIAGESGLVVFTIVGTLVLGGDTVDKLSFGAEPSLRRSISMVSADGRSLRVGSGGGGVDADGYPNSLSTVVYVKQ